VEDRGTAMVGHNGHKHLASKHFDESLLGEQGVGAQFMSLTCVVTSHLTDSVVPFSSQTRPLSFTESAPFAISAIISPTSVLLTAFDVLIS